MSMKRGKPEGKNRRDVNAVQRVALALELRAKKIRLVDIAAQCGYASAGACYNAIQRELQRVVVENVEELRREEADGLDKLEAECWARLEEEGFEKAKLFAVDRILMIKERRAKLMGLDKRPDEQLANQNYTKKIIIVGGQDEHSND
jgi:hypothetical protein